MCCKHALSERHYLTLVHKEKLLRLLHIDVVEDTNGQLQVTMYPHDLISLQQMRFTAVIALQLK